MRDGLWCMREQGASQEAEAEGQSAPQHLSKPSTELCTVKQSTNISLHFACFGHLELPIDTGCPWWDQMCTIICWVFDGTDFHHVNWLHKKKHLLTGYAQQNETGQCFMSSLFQCNTAIMRACLRLGSFHTHSNLQCCQGIANAHWRFATSCGWQCQENLLFHINLVLGPLLKWTCTNSCVPPRKTHLHACTNK